MKLCVAILFSAGSAVAMIDASPSPQARLLATLPQGSYGDGQPPDATPPAFRTFLSTCRQTIDLNVLGKVPVSDEPFVSVGASDDFGDGLGSLKATAILFKTVSYPVRPDGVVTPNPPPIPYIPDRVDFFLYRRALQSGTFPADVPFEIALFSDDDSETHNPLLRVRSFERSVHSCESLIPPSRSCCRLETL